MKTELLAPAGNMPSLIKAIQNGADSVYLGLKSFGARAFAGNFTFDELIKAIAYAHTYGVKVYVTMNTLVYQDETEEFLSNAEAALKAGADALIMQDAGMIAAVKRRFPDTEIHASTQMHNHNDAALEFVYRLGAKRAVLAREMDIAQIKSLKCPIEKEVFIHGALCICYSGQCLFSALTNGRSGNRGMCAQSCRMRYRLVDENGKEYFTNGEYLLSPKDIGLFEDIGALPDAGVGCFKIEGRMKSPEYVGLTTKIYAKLLRDYHDGKPLKPDPEDIRNLLCLFNRGYSKSHLFNVNGEALMSKDRPNHRGTMLGKVISIGQDRIRLRLSAPLNQGDGIKFEQSDDGFICNKIYLNGLLTASAKAGDIVELDAKAGTHIGDTVVKTTDSKLLKLLQNDGKRYVAISGTLTALSGKPLRLELIDDDGHKAIAEGCPVEPSRSAPISRCDLMRGIEKLGDTPYRLSSCTINADENIFIPKSALNALRREAVESLTHMRTFVPEIAAANIAPPKLRSNDDTDSVRLHILVRTPEQFDAVKDMAAGNIYTEDVRLYFQNKSACPRLMLKTDRLAEHPESFHGERLLVTDHGGLQMYARGNDIVLDHSVFALNAETLTVFLSHGVKRIALSPELDAGQTRKMIEAFDAQNHFAPPVEAVLWARHELMGMRHCMLLGALGKTACDLCGKTRFYLKDEKGNRFPILRSGSCKSRIFHSRVIKASAQDYLLMGVKHFRIELFDEDGKESRKIAERILRQIERRPV